MFEKPWDSQGARHAPWLGFGSGAALNTAFEKPKYPLI